MVIRFTCPFCCHVDRADLRSQGLFSHPCSKCRKSYTISLSLLEESDDPIPIYGESENEVATQVTSNARWNVTMISYG